MPDRTREKAVAELVSLYEKVVLVGENEFVAVGRLMFHYMMIRGDVGEDGYENRWCYGPDPGDVIAALVEWSLRDYEGEPIKWNRHPSSGRRRPDGDESKEYINF